MQSPLSGFKAWRERRRKSLCVPQWKIATPAQLKVCVVYVFKWLFCECITSVEAVLHSILKKESSFSKGETA